MHRLCWLGLAAVASLVVICTSLSICCRVSSCLECIWQRLYILPTNLDQRSMWGPVLTWFKWTAIPSTPDKHCSLLKGLELSTQHSSHNLKSWLEWWQQLVEQGRACARCMRGGMVVFLRNLWVTRLSKNCTWCSSMTPFFACVRHARIAW